MNFKSNKAYKKWLAYGHASGEFAKTPGHQSVSIKGKPKSVKHRGGGPKSNSKNKYKISETDSERYLDLKERLLNTEVPSINLGLPENNYNPSNIYKYAFAEPSPEGFFGLATLGSNELGLEGTIGGYLPYDIRTNPYFKGDYFANVQKHFPKLSVGVGANKAIFGYPDQSGNFTKVASGITPNFNLRFNLKHGGKTEDPPLTAMMKARLAYANEFGNPAAQRMISPTDNPYKFDNGYIGTHYMSSIDNYAVPQIQDVNGKLVLGDFGPESNEAIRFDRNEDADYFAKHYKEVSPAFKYKHGRPYTTSTSITDPLFKKISKEVGSNINPNWENEYFHYSPDRKKVWKTIPDRFKNFQQDIFNKYANEPQFRKVTTVWRNGGSIPNIPTWNYPSKGTPIYRDTSEIPPVNNFRTGGFMGENPPAKDYSTIPGVNKEKLTEWNNLNKSEPTTVEEAKLLAEAVGYTPQQAIVVAAQWALESGRGKNTGGDYNYFGIKSHNQAVRNRMSDLYGLDLSAANPTATSEVENGKNVTTTSSFMNFANPIEAFLGHKAFLETNNRYADALSKTTSAEFAQELQKAGYATAPNYSKLLRDIAVPVVGEEAYGTEVETVEEPVKQERKKFNNTIYFQDLMNTNKITSDFEKNLYNRNYYKTLVEPSESTSIIIPEVDKEVLNEPVYKKPSIYSNPSSKKSN